MPSGLTKVLTDLTWRREYLDVVHLLEGLLDLVLVHLQVDDEDEGVFVLHFLHGLLGSHRVFQNVVLLAVEHLLLHLLRLGGRHRRLRRQVVLGGPVLPQGLWPVEAHLGKVSNTW